jgi:hypothetical protein
MEQEYLKRIQDPIYIEKVRKAIERDSEVFRFMQRLNLQRRNESPLEEISEPITPSDQP